jgi:hypothetical protein
VIVVNWSYLLGGGAVFFAIASGVPASAIADFLIKRGVEVNRRHFTWLRRAVLGYLRKYRTMTRSETGRTGASYFVYIGCIVGALVLLAAAIAVRFL